MNSTFFVLGKVAESHPSLTREIAAAGHEVGTHGYSHESVEAMPVARFREEEIPYRVPTLVRWSQGTNRRSVRAKLRRLCAEFRLVPMAVACRGLRAEHLAVGLDLGRPPVAYGPRPAEAG